MTPKPEHSPLSACTGWEKACCFFLLAGSLIYYWLIFFHHALDAGQADDFVDVLWFFEIFRVQENWLDKLAVIALPNHEHITIFNHLVYLADYALFGKINFFHYMFVGHLIILACCFLLAEWLQKSVGWWYALALAFGIFLNLFYWNASFWAMTALSNQVVVLFALLAARSIARKPDAIVMPLLWGLLAVTAQFNGLLVLPVIILSTLLVARIEPSYRYHRQLLVWGCAALVVSAIYVIYENPLARDHLWRYVEYTDPGKIDEYFKPSYGQPVSTARALLNIPLTFLAAVGATIFGLTRWEPPAITGAICILFLLRAVINRTGLLQDRLWLAALLFVLASLAMVAVGRGFGFGPESGLYYRYRLYSYLLLVLMVGAVLRDNPGRRSLLICMLLAVVVQLSSLCVLPDIDKERENVKVSYYNWLVDGGMGRSQMPFYPHNQDWRLFNAYQNGYYNPYNALDRQHKPAAVSCMDNPHCAADVPPLSAESPAVKVWSKKARALAVEISLDIKAQEAPVQLLFCDNAAGYLVELDAHNINRSTGKYWPILVLKNQLPPSQYRVILRKAGVSNQIPGQVKFP